MTAPMSPTWLKTLGVEETETVAKTIPRNTRLVYTERDYETLQIILNHPKGDEMIDGHPRYCEISNGQLGKKLGISGGAAAARVQRLAKLAVIRPLYETAIKTGRTTRRTIEVLCQPPLPYTTEG